MLRKIFSLIEGASQGDDKNSPFCTFTWLCCSVIPNNYAWNQAITFLFGMQNVLWRAFLENPVKLWSLLVVVSSQILTTKCCKTPRVPTSLHWEGIRWQKMWVLVSILPLSATSTLFFLRKWVFSERKVNAYRGFVSNSHQYWITAHLECLIPMWFLTGP